MTDQAKAQARIFYVETQLHMLARSPDGGVARHQALKAATSEVNKMGAAFDIWLEREMASLLGAVEQAKSGAPQAEWLDQAMIHCRQLHDVSGTMGCELVTLVADLLYKTFEGVAAGAPLRIDTITCYVDALQLVKQEQYRNLRAEQVSDLISGLRQMAERVNGVAM